MCYVSGRVRLVSFLLVALRLGHSHVTSVARGSLLLFNVVFALSRCQVRCSVNSITTVSLTVPPPATAIVVRSALRLP